MRLTRVEAAAVAVVVVGVAVRVARAAADGALDWDVAWYATMARAVLAGEGFATPWDGAPTHHYPPGYPLVLAAGYAVLGPGLAATKAVSLALGVACVAVVFLLSRDLYGRETGLVCAAVVAATPLLVVQDARGYPESLLVATYALTLWGIVRSLSQPRYILVAGAGAAASYLVKASLGPFFLLAGLGGLAWRVHHRGWRALADRWYLAAAGVFGLAVAAWAGRNVVHFGLAGWETQPHATRSVLAAFARDDVVLVLAAKWLGLVLVLGAFTLPLWAALARAARGALADERRSALWLGALMPGAIATLFMAGFHATEGRPLFDPDDARYVVVGLVPLLWLALGEVPSARRRGAEPRALPVAAGFGAVVLALEPGFFPEGARGFLLAAGLFGAAFAARRASRLGPAFAALLGGAVASALTVPALFAYGAAGAVALLFEAKAARAVAFAAALVLVPLVGTTAHAPWAAVGEALPEGADVAVSPGRLHFAAAVAPEGARLSVWDVGAGAGWIVDASRPASEAVEGHREAAAFAGVVEDMPATALQREALGRPPLRGEPRVVVVWAPE